MTDKAKKGRLSARPSGTATSLARGKVQPLERGLYYLPEKAVDPVPLVVGLHGAGGRASRTVEHLRPFADQYGFLLLVPQSLGQSWDLVEGALGPDVEAIDKSLAHLFARAAVDRKRLAVSGFSDGASYALTLGITNGDLFTHVIAFSPGFAAVKEQNGRPRVFVSHGTEDEILPIDRCGRRVAAQLRDGNYPVTYREFEGPHTVPEEVAGEAFADFAGAP